MIDRAHLYISQELMLKVREYLLSTKKTLYGEVRRFTESAVKEKLAREKQKLKEIEDRETEEEVEIKLDFIKAVKQATREQ